MKCLIILSIFTAACSNYNPENIRFKDTVVVTKGFYKNCQGEVKEEMEWILPCHHKFLISSTCKDKYISEFISVCNLKKVKGNENY